jgi:hypothetical protein
MPHPKPPHGLRRLAVTEAVRGSYDQAKAAIDQLGGKVLGKRHAEHLVIAAARDIDAFYRRRIPLRATADTLLILPFDGKGIVIRPEALQPAEKRLGQCSAERSSCGVSEPILCGTNCGAPEPASRAASWSNAPRPSRPDRSREERPAARRVDYSTRDGCPVRARKACVNHVNTGARLGGTGHPLMTASRCQ